MYYVGIDWADDHHDICVIDAQVNKLASKRIEHNPTGFTALSNLLKKFTTDPDELAICIETSGGLLVNFLLEAGYNIYPVNPNTLDRKRNPAGVKTDQIDAYMLAKHVRNEKQDLRLLKADNPQIEELKALCRDQDSLIKEQTRLINRLKACLKLYYPVSLDFFGKVNQPITVNFLLAYPTVDKVQVLSQSELTAWLKEHKHTKAQECGAKIYQLVHQPQLQAREPIIRAKSVLMVALVNMLKVVAEQVNLYDEQIVTLFWGHEDHVIFESLPKAATRLAPRLLAEFGDDRDRYENERSIQALGGVAPTIKQSGKCTIVHRRIAYVKPLGQALYDYAWVSLSEPWAREYYDRKRAEGKTNSEALRALANVWVRIIYAMWRDRTLYEGGKFRAAQQAHSGPRMAKAS